MLPDLGLHGNTHYAFGELNNVEFADLLEADMRSLGLLNNDKPYQGPTRKMLEDYNIPFKKLWPEQISRLLVCETDRGLSSLWRWPPAV